MTANHRASASSATSVWPALAPGRLWRSLPIGAAMASFALVAVFTVVPTAPGAVTSAAQGNQQAERNQPAEAQTLVATGHVATPEITRDAFAITPGRTTFISGGTNYDWAKLVLLNGGWPVTENNVTVITRWMRQENFIDTWWNRNNPLNNGWGSGGGSGLGSYPSLQVAAQNAAEALNTHPGYGEIRASFAASAPAEVTEQAIWASPWASGHYANGSHWHYSAVPVVKAPAGAW